MLDQIDIYLSDLFCFVWFNFVRTYALHLPIFYFNAFLLLWGERCVRACVRAPVRVCVCVRACVCVCEFKVSMYVRYFIFATTFLSFFFIFYYSYRYLFFCLHKHLLDILEGFSLLLLGCSGTFHQS